MNRNHLREARRLLGRSTRRMASWSPWEWCNLATASFVPPGLRKACKNNAYVVQFHERETPFGTVDHLMIQNVSGEPVRSWPDLQRIKNELCGPEREAVEVYPPVSELVDDCNVYHLWVLPTGVRLGFGLRYLAEAAPVGETARQQARKGAEQ